MSDKKTLEKEKIIGEFKSYTKKQLSDALLEWGIKTSSREKKDELLETLADFIIANREEAEKSASESQKEEKQSTDSKSAKNLSESKKGAKSRKKRSGKVPEITKERREVTKEVRKTKTEALESEEALKRARGEDIELKPRVIKNAPDSLTIDGRRRVRTAERDEDFELTESFSSPSVMLKGELLMIKADTHPWVRRPHPVTGETKTYYQVAAVIKYKSRFVYIPAQYFFEDYWNMDQSKVGKYILERRGSIVEFRVINVSRENPEEPVYIGSRIAALKKARCDYWYSDRDIGRSLLEPDSIHEAQIVSVADRVIFVEMYGVDVAIPEKEVRYNRIKSLKLTDYYPGDIIDVKIKSVVLQDKKRAEALGYPVECSLSIKAAKPDPRDKYFKQGLKDVEFMGIVRDREIDSDNVTWYWVEMGETSDTYSVGEDEGLPIRCKLYDKMAVIPKEGDIASGKIVFANEKEKRVWGTIYHVDPPRIRRGRRM